MSSDAKPVRYTVLGLVATGGFGEVYKARMEADGGFTKDVALKLLRPHVADEDMVKRLRDEARILALVQDRALTSVDPPTQLDGRWAMVMEYVPGRTLAHLRQVAPLPSHVVAAIAAEIARCLEKCHTQPGLDGRPLQLVHRDLKPGNVMLTPDGAVRWLDFGLALAAFDAREAKSVTAVGGTAGYIPPERLFGIDRPEGDLFSLGVMMQVLLLGVSAKRLVNPERTHARLLQAGVPAKLADLTLDLRDHDPDSRPSHDDIMRICNGIARLYREDLRGWCRANVDVAPLDETPLSGTALGFVAPVEMSQASTMTTSALITGGVGLTATLFFTGVLGVLFLAMTAAWVVYGRTSAGPVSEPIDVQAMQPTPVVRPVPVVEPSPVPEPVVLPEPVPSPSPAPATPLPQPVAAPAVPTPVVLEPVVPEPVVPEPVVPEAAPDPPQPAVSQLSIDLLCASGVARVTVDGAGPWTTPARGVRTAQGMHTVVFTGACTGTGRFLFGGRRGCVGVTATGDQLRSTGCR
jgi:serine/threonine-protein kinase